jgi:hypothetical protein
VPLDHLAQQSPRRAAEMEQTSVARGGELLLGLRLLGFGSNGSSATIEVLQRSANVPSSS